MIKLEELSLNNLDNIRTCLTGAPNICDFSAGTLYTWKDFYQFEYANVDGEMVIYSRKDNSFFPSWRMSPSQYIELLKRITQQQIILSPVPESLLDKYLPYGKATEIVGWADYLYSAKELIDLNGKKFHSKRNHIVRFKDSYNYTFAPIEVADLPELMAFVSTIGENVEGLSLYDVDATKYALANLDALKLLSGVLRIEDKIVGLTLGEVCADTLIVHTERCDRAISGGYEQLAHLFVCQYAQDCVYVNREEDLGNEGLRRAKESWQPIKMLKKYTVVID